MKTIQIKLITLIVFLLCFGSTSVYAGIFDLVGEIEFGLGAGFNSDYWNIGKTKIEPRARTIAYLNKIKGADVVQARDPEIQKVIRKFLTDDPDFPPSSIESAVIGLGVTGRRFAVSGTSISVSGINVDIQANYHIFSWLFLRSGATIDIAIPTEFALRNRFTISNLPDVGEDDLRSASFTETVTYKVSGLDIEVPILLGFNLIKTDNFSAYTAIGVNLSFGGYEETLSGSRSGTPDVFKDLLPNGDFDAVTNKYDAFQIGLQWLVGIKHQFTDNISIFTEIKWLEAANIIDKTGTKIPDDADSTEAETKPVKATTKLALGKAINSNVSGISPIELINDTEKGKKGEVRNNVSGLLNRSYVRWVIGATYTIGF